MAREWRECPDYWALGMEVEYAPTDSPLDTVARYPQDFAQPFTFQVVSVCPEGMRITLTRT